MYYPFLSNLIFPILINTSSLLLVVWIMNTATSIFYVIDKDQAQTAGSKKITGSSEYFGHFSLKHIINIC